MQLLTTLQADILGVAREGYGVYPVVDEPSAIDFESAALALMIGKYMFEGQDIPSAYTKEMSTMGLTVIPGKYGGGLVPVCKRMRLTLNDVMNEIHLNIVQFETTQDANDFWNEYWEARWLAHTNPEVTGLSAFSNRIKSSLKAAGKACMPLSLSSVTTDDYLDRYLAEHLGLYAIATMDLVIPDRITSEWEEIIEINWIKTTESRIQEAQRMENKILIAPSHELDALEIELQDLRPTPAMAQLGYLLKKTPAAMTKLLTRSENYEYGAAKISASDFTRLFDLIHSRRLGFINGQESNHSYSNVASGSQGQAN